LDNLPRLSNGRLMIGTIIPFAVLTAVALGRIKAKSIRIATLSLTLLLLNGMSAWMLSDAFNGRYSNFLSNF
jgi:hypothetical protein